MKISSQQKIWGIDSLPALESLVGDVTNVVEVWCQFFDARVSGVDNEDVIASVDGNAAWLHESFLFGATCPKNDLEWSGQNFYKI